jgi:cytochrome c2
MSGCLRGLIASAILIVAITAGVLFAVQRKSARETAPPGYPGDPVRGGELVVRYGCPACHIIPDMAPRGLIGPTLGNIGARSYIAGRFPNRPIEMAQWIQHPQAMKPGTSMPDLGVTQHDADDIAAYLATLR